MPKKKPRNITLDEETWDTILEQAKQSGKTNRSAQIRELARLREDYLIKCYFDFLKSVVGTVGGKGFFLWEFKYADEINRISESKGIGHTRAWNLLVDIGEDAVKRRFKKLGDISFQLEKGPFQCPYCETMVDTREELEAHIKAAHPKALEQALRAEEKLLSATLYFCPHCDDGPFQTKTELKKHVKAVHPEKYNVLYRSGRKVGK